MAGLLLRLSQAYANGHLDHESYRQRRAELIERILNSEEEIAFASLPDSDTTVSRDLALTRSQTKSLDIYIPFRPGLMRWRRDVKSYLVIAASVIAVLIVSLLYLSGDDAGDQDIKKQAVDSKASYDMPAIEVLQTITQSMLADGELDDDEVLYFLNLWDVTEENERTNWTRYASQILLQAVDDNDETTVANLENLLFEVDYDTSSLIASAGPPAVADIDPDASDDEDAESIDLASSSRQEPASGEQTGNPDAAEDPSAPMLTANDMDHSALLESQKNLDQAAQALDIAPSSPPGGEIAAPAQPEQEELKEGQSAQPGEMTAAGADVAGTGSTIDADALIQVPIDSPTIDAAFVQLRSSSALTERELVIFIDAWKSASPAEKRELARSSTITEFAATQNRIVEELSPYTYESRDNDDRKTRLLRVNRILRQLVKIGLEQQNDSTADWLWNTDENYYTLQLIGSRSKNNILEYMAKQRVPEDYAYFETRLEDKSWFVVVGGQYPDREAAMAAIERLPATSEGGIKPWARSLQSVREDIRAQSLTGQQ